MRFLHKLDKPQVLIDNEFDWLADYKADPKNDTKKYRYRAKEIKEALTEETAFKCIYCESRIGQVTPGDIEHKIPSSKKIDLHFSWENLTIACNECNRRKNDYYELDAGFLDPYVDPVEQFVEHHGPLVYWVPGNIRAEISISILELSSKKRSQLIFDKLEKIQQIQHLYERYISTVNPGLKAILKEQLEYMADKTCEYSGMVLEILKKRGLCNN